MNAISAAKTRWLSGGRAELNGLGQSHFSTESSGTVALSLLNQAQPSKVLKMAAPATLPLVLLLSEWRIPDQSERVILTSFI